jgi:hypothetical protein
VVDGQAEVALDGPDGPLLGLDAGEHPEVVRGVAEVGAGREGLLAPAAPPCGGREHRDLCRDADEVALAFGLREVPDRAKVQLGTQRGQARPEARHGGEVTGGEGGQRRGHRIGNGLSGPDGGPEAGQLGDVRQVPAQQEVPDLLDRAGAGQVDGAELPVVVEALLAADVAEARGGDDDAGQSGR